jgi:hypothetical protein
MEIQGYSFGKITIDGQTYTRDVLILPDRVWDGWWRATGHRLGIEDLDEALKSGVEVLVVGTGLFGLMSVPAETSKELEKRGIELHTMPTPKAWALFNELRSRECRVAAALHLSC